MKTASQTRAEPPASGVRDASGGRDLENVRWLANAVIGRPMDVPVPLLVSMHIWRNAIVADYVAWWMEHPDAGSTFEKRSRWLRWLPRALRWRLMSLFGYDGIVYLRGNGAIEGHMFFQRRGCALHGFSTAANEHASGKGHSVVFMLDYVGYAAQLPGILRARVGTGRNAVTRRLLERIRRIEDKLGWSVSTDGWVVFGDAEAAQSDRA